MHFATHQQIYQRMDWVLASPSNSGRVEMIAVRPKTDDRKVIPQAFFSPIEGVAGDNWHQHCWKRLDNGQSDPDVQVAIMNARMIDVLTDDKSLWPLAGDQLFVDLDLSTANLSPGDQLQIGAATLEITSEPHRGCQKFQQRFGRDALKYVNSTQGDALRLRGVYAKIVTAGDVRMGDDIVKC